MDMSGVRPNSVAARANLIRMWRSYRDSISMPHRVFGNNRSSAAVVSFIQHLVNHNFGFNTVRAAAYEVVRHHNKLLGPGYGIDRDQAFTNALKRAQDGLEPPDSTPVISGERLREIVTSLDPRDFNSMAVRTFLVLAFATCSRPSNLARSPRAPKTHTLVWSSVRAYPDIEHATCLHLKELSSKSSSRPRSIWVGSCAPANIAVCPTQTLLAWRDLLGQHRDTPASDVVLWYRRADGAYVELTPAHVNATLRKWQRDSGVMPGARITSKVMRGSGATALFTAGATKREVAKRAGWQLDVVEVFYARDGKDLALQTTDKMMTTTNASLDRGTVAAPDRWDDVPADGAAGVPVVPGL